MTLDHLEVLVEEQSMEAALELLLPKMLPDTSFHVHTHQGPMPHPTKLTRKQVIADLRRMEAELGRPLRSIDVVERHNALYIRALNFWGSFEGARRGAGLRRKPSLMYWTRERCIAELQQLHRAGVRISTQDLYERKDVGGLFAGLARLGGIVRARALAGIPDPPRRANFTERYSWDTARVVRELRRLHRGGESIAASRVSSDLKRAAVTHFGSYRDAIEAAGFRYEDICLRRPLSDEELCDRLRDFARKHPTIHIGEAERKAQGATLRLRFGSLVEAARRAGLHGWPQLGRSQIDREATLTSLRQRATRRKSLSSSAIQKDDPPLIHACLRHFGGLVAALEAAGLKDVTSARSEKTRAWVIEEIRRRVARDQPLNLMAIRRDHPALEVRACYHFKNWSKAVVAAGLPDPRLTRPATRRPPRRAPHRG